MVELPEKGLNGVKELLQLANSLVVHGEIRFLVDENDPGHGWSGGRPGDFAFDASTGELPMKRSGGR